MTPARICVAPLIDACLPALFCRSANVCGAMSMRPKPSVTTSVKPELLAARDRDADLVAEELLDLVVVEAARHDARDAELLRALEPAQVDVAPADDDLAAHRLRERRGVEHRARLGDAHRERRLQLAAESEDPLHERGGRLHGAAFARVHLDDAPVDVRVDLDRDGARLHDHLAGDRRDALDRPAHDRLRLAPEEPEEAVGLRDELALGDTVARPS